MAQYDDWLDGVNTNIASQAGSAANVPRVIVVHAVRSVVRGFLNDTDSWVHKPQNIVERLTDRVLMIPRDTYICKVWQLRGESDVTDRITYSHPNVLHLDLLDDSEIRRIPIKDIEVSLSVTQTSLECPMFIFDRYYDGILSGVLANLQAMPGKAWAEPSMVAYHRSVFESAMMTARQNVSAGFNRQKSRQTLPANFI